MVDIVDNSSAGYQIALLGFPIMSIDSVVIKDELEENIIDTARPGDILSIIISMRNNTTIIDIPCFAKVIDYDTGELLGELRFPNSNFTVMEFYIKITMPDKNLNIRVDVGHEENQGSLNPLQMKDLQNITLDPNYPSSSNVFYIRTPLLDFGYIISDGSPYVDLDESASLQSTHLRLNKIGADLPEGEITLTYDGGKTIKVYLPAVTTYAANDFYIAEDGSTYYDAALTQLARGA